MDNNVPHHQYADGPNPNNIFLHIPKWKGWPRKSFVSTPRLSFSSLAYFVDLFDREQIFKWDVENLNCVWGSITHCWSTLYIWCWYSMKSARVYSCTVLAPLTAPACRCFQFYIVSRQIWISDLQPGTRGIRQRLHVLTGDLVTRIDDSL